MDKLNKYFTDLKLKSHDITKIISVINFRFYQNYPGKNTILYFSRSLNTQMLFSLLNVPIKNNIIVIYNNNYLYFELKDDLTIENTQILNKFIKDKITGCGLCTVKHNTKIAMDTNVISCSKCKNYICVEHFYKMIGTKICPYCRSVLKGKINLYR